MGWINSTEKYKFKVEQEQRLKEYKAAKMPAESIQKMQEYDKREYNNRRNYLEHINEISLESMSSTFSSNAFVSKDDDRNPFFHGFEDERLNIIVQNSDEVDLKIISLMYQGYSEREISKLLKISRKTIQKAKRKFRHISQTFKK